MRGILQVVPGRDRCAAVNFARRASWSIFKNSQSSRISIKRSSCPNNRMRYTQPMAPDCEVVRGQVPGPASHALCGPHGHVLDTNSRTVIAHRRRRVQEAVSGLRFVAHNKEAEVLLGGSVDFSNPSSTEPKLASGSLRVESAPWKFAKLSWPVELDPRITHRDVPGEMLPRLLESSAYKRMSNS